ncbi:DNA translocase FtsK 4TM domain-containing protein, partial [Nonomuraea bangladeshensis]|uniref:DNA translocase FtsK 4TM domain-containing protein n=1 Tax=Nonomuraea bangladeshensis TaxID=404385 RepID=UPI003C2E9C7C
MPAQRRTRASATRAKTTARTTSKIKPRSTPTRRPSPSKNPLGRMLNTLLREGWNLTVKATAAAVRAARNLDEAQQRDGIALAITATAVILAAIVWRIADGPAAGLDVLIRACVGVGAWPLPLLALMVAWRVLRAKVSPRRTVTGWCLLAAVLLALVHIGQGLPAPVGERGSWEAVSAAGGLVGWFLAAPPVRILPMPVAIVLLLLLAVFGLLLITGVPLHTVPQRARHGGRRLLARAATRRARAGDRDDAERPALARTGTAPSPAAAPAPRPATAPPPAPAIQKPTTPDPQPAAHDSPRQEPEPEAQPATRAPDNAPAVSSTPAAELLPATVHDHSPYVLPDPALLQAGRPPRPQTKANTIVVNA